MTLTDLQAKFRQFIIEVEKETPDYDYEDIKFSRFREWLENNE